MLKNKDYYNKVFAKSITYKKTAEHTLYYKMWRNILGLISREDKIIEIGCGTGQLAKMLIDNNFNYIKGFDYSETGIEICHTLNPVNKDKFSVRNIYDIEKLDKGYVYICTEVLEHLENDFHVIDILPEGANFIFSVPNFKFESHVRHFVNKEQIIERYKGLDITEIEIFHKIRQAHLFLCKSKKI